MRSARSSARTKPASLKVGCSPSIGHPSTCRAPKRCCSHCVSFSRHLLILCCNKAATGTPVRGAPDDDGTSYARWWLDRFPSISGNERDTNTATSDLINILDTVDVPILVLRGDYTLA